MKTTTKFNYAASTLIIVTICGLSGNTVAQAPHYVLKDLGTLGGFTSDGTSTDNSSQVTGSSSIPSGFLYGATVADFNGDGHPDFVLRNAMTRQTAIWYLNNNVLIGTAFGPTLPSDWLLLAVGDFNRDTHTDYALFTTDQSAIWYLSGPTFIGSAYGPTIPNGWVLVGAADFNGDGNPDYVLCTFFPTPFQTAIWYLNNNVFLSGAFGPSLPGPPNPWWLLALADFNRDGHPDYALWNEGTGQTAIWYLSGPTGIGSAYGPTIPSGWTFMAAADFNGDGNPDYLLYNVNTRQTAIWYLNNNVLIGTAYGPTVPSGWSLVPPP